MEFKRVAKFEIVSFEQFKTGFDNLSDEEIKKI